MEKKEFKVFLAHNSLDKPFVRIIAEELKRFDINSWLDEEEILAGQNFQSAIEQAISKVNSAAICIGHAGFGRWQVLELRAFIEQCVERQIPVIPVLLPGVSEIPESSVFLRQFNWVSFKDSIDDEAALIKLVQGINGSKEVGKIENTPSLSEIIIDSSARDISKLQGTKVYLQNLKSSKEFAFQQLSLSINNFSQYIQMLQIQKEDLEKKIDIINERIKLIESILCDASNQNLLLAIDWLRNHRPKLAKSAGDFIIKKINVDNSVNGDLREFYWSLEKFVEIVEHCLISGDDDLLSLVECLPFQLPYMNYADEGIKYIRNRINKQDFSEEVKAEINTCLDKIIDCLNYLKAN